MVVGTEWGRVGGTATAGRVGPRRAEGRRRSGGECVASAVPIDVGGEVPAVVAGRGRLGVRATGRGGREKKRVVREGTGQHLTRRNRSCARGSDAGIVVRDRQGREAASGV